MDNRIQGWLPTIGLTIVGVVMLILAFQSSLFQELGLLPLQDILSLLQGHILHVVSLQGIPLLAERIISPCIAAIGIATIICGCLIGLLKLIK
jgi:hypothetical protein